VLQYVAYKYISRNARMAYEYYFVRPIVFGNTG
jgi:hypothetical protein